MFCLIMRSTHFIYSYIALNRWLLIEIKREENSCHGLFFKTTIDIYVVSICT